MAKVIKAPSINVDVQQRIFLGGTIDNGESENWQDKFIETWQKLEADGKVYPNTVIFNPRRETPPTNLVSQIEWELDHLETSDVIIMNILPNSKSPISLMEIGLFARSNKIVVVCPEEFYRYTNVRVVCERYSITLVNTIEEVFDLLR